MKLLFVCLGNICRSPTAHAVFRHLAQIENVDVEVESAGTSAYHEGAKPDSRSQAVGDKRGYNFAGISSRKIRTSDFEDYDLILAMDKENLANLMKKCPEHLQAKVKLMLEFSDKFGEFEEVPDPYYGGAAGFELVLDMIEDASVGLLRYIKQTP